MTVPPVPSQFWQLYNSVTLIRLAGHEDCKEWQVRIALAHPNDKWNLKPSVKYQDSKGHNTFGSSCGHQGLDFWTHADFIEVNSVSLSSVSPLSASTCPTFGNRDMAPVVKLHVHTCPRNKTDSPFFPSGVYVGVDVSHPVPGQLSHHGKSCAPENPEKPGEGAKNWLRHKLNKTPQILPNGQ